MGGSTRLQSKEPQNAACGKGFSEKKDDPELAGNVVMGLRGGTLSVPAGTWSLSVQLLQWKRGKVSSATWIYALDYE